MIQYHDCYGNIIDDKNIVSRILINRKELLVTMKYSVSNESLTTDINKSLAEANRVIVNDMDDFAEGRII